MAQYAYFDIMISAPSPVIGWYDTEKFQYPNLPPMSNLLEVTTSQWEARLANPSGWAVSGNTLIDYVAPTPTPTPTQQASAQYAEIIASGLTVTSQANGLMGVFGISSIPNAAGDSNTSEINAEVAFINNFGEFTNGTTSGLVWPLLNGQTTTFSSTGQFLAFAKASAQYVAACKLAAASLAAGQTPTWPNANIEIP